MIKILTQVIKKKVLQLALQFKKHPVMILILVMWKLSDIVGQFKTFCYLLVKLLQAAGCLINYAVISLQFLIRFLPSIISLFYVSKNKELYHEF